MYSLRQVYIQVYDNIRTCLAPHGCSTVTGTVEVWKHETRLTRFCVCVNDFSITYFNKDDADHLFQSIGKHYQYTIEWKGNTYCRLTLDGNYPNSYVEISIPGYVDKILKRLQHNPAQVP